jgi:flagellar biosynthesis protein FlhF
LKLKTYQAWTMSEALAFVKKDLGADAVILHTRTFERGGFFGFGRKAVVEITAARAADMPKGEQVLGEGEKSDASTSERRGAPRVFKSATLAGPSASVASTGNASNGSAAASTSLAARAAKNEVVQLSAAARAYGAASQTGNAGVARSGTRGNAANVGSASGASVHSGMHPVMNTGMPLDMDAEREKTRRLAQAMAIQLEKQTSERANAARNERATGAAARATGAAARATGAAARAGESASKPASAFGTPSAARITSPESGVVTTEPVGPAQRFVLVPEVRVIGANSGGAGATVARLQTIVVPASQVASASTVSASSVSASEVSVSVAAPHADVVPAASHASHTTVSRTADIAEPTPATERRELDTISAFVGRFLHDGNGESRGASVETKPHATGARATEQRLASAAAEKAPRASETTRVALNASSHARPATLEAAYAQLIEQEVARELADRILAKVESELADAIDAGATPSASIVREAIEREIAALLPADSEDGFRFESAMRAAHTRADGRGHAGSARRIAFVGPTGVGKTTTLAKIAAQLSLKRGLKVGIVAADTYRIAAVDQLRTYAEILGIAVEVASSPTDAARACERLGDVDVILIDTAGRSQNDRMKLSELRAFLAAAGPDETHLVLSATAGARTLAREAESFGALGIDRLVLTKLDEAASFGTLISLVERLGTRVSFLTHGQEVPEHIETARGRRLASLVMGSEVR